MIDYLAVGVGSGGAVEIDTLAPLAVASREEERQVADEVNGMRFCIAEYGSDHLPVACTITTTTASFSCLEDENRENVSKI